MTTEDIDWKKMHKGFKDALTTERRQQLASEWNIRASTLQRLGVGWDNSTDSYTFPERNGKKQIVGILRRNATTGNKRAVPGSKRGPSIPSNWKSHDGPVYVPEGPSDTAVLTDLGFNAVGRPSCNGGVEKLAELFKDCNNPIVVVGENDEKSDGSWPGRDGAIKVATRLTQLLEVQVTWTLPPEGYKDVREYVESLAEDDIESRRNKLNEHFLENQYDAPDDQEMAIEAEQIPVFSNFDFESSGEKTRCVGRFADDIFEHQMEIFGYWPKRVRDQLFVIDDNYQVQMLDTPAKLIAYFDSKAKVEWSSKDDCVSQPRYYEFSRTKVEHFDAIETVPHFPARPNTYYAHPPLPQASGEHLSTLLAFFTPETDQDRQLLQAFIMTLVWGCEPGCRPAFLFTGPENDTQPEKNGRGVGKSTVVQLVSELVGGLMSFSAAGTDFSRIVTRLLSKEGMKRRICLIDNVKTMKLSWGELEGLITSPVISGHDLFKGEGQRPNNLVWALTLNGATLSKDLAERCVIIRLARPEQDPLWRSNVLSFVRENRWQILADIQALLTV